MATNFGDPGDLPLPADGVCPECGSTQLTLGVDTTEYVDVRLVDGELRRSGFSHEEFDDARIFCDICGTYFCFDEVPG